MSIFAAWPPEFISALIYSGPGSGPMAEAAAAWESLAADLQSSATSLQSVVSTLGGAWQGSSGATMTAAAEPYLNWIQGTALQAQNAGAQATQAATAFDTAYAGTVHPAAIAANRTQLTALIATNFFGQNFPAIAATEMEYAAMWATDVATLTNYAFQAMEATVLQAFDVVPQVANGLFGGVTSLSSSLGNTVASLPSSMSSLLGGMPNLVPTAISQMVTPTASAANVLAAVDPTAGGSGLSSILGSLGSVFGLGGAGSSTSSATTAMQAAYYGTMIGSTPARMFMGMGNSMASSSSSMLDSQGLLNTIGQFVDGKLQTVAGGLTTQLRSWGSAVSAQLAHASSIGKLSVPEAWSTAAPAMSVSRAAPVLPATSVSAPSLTPPSASMPGGPFGQALMGSLSGRGLSSLAAKTPKVVPRHASGG